MGYGQNLKEAIDKKGWTIAKCAKEAHMKQQTLYTIIRRDTSVRYDFAICLASVLGIDINMLTKDNPYDIEEFEPPLPESHGETSELHNRRAYRKMRMNVELDLFEHKDYPILHELITKFFVLDDEGRRQVIDSENVIAMRHTDETRKKWLSDANKSNSKIRKQKSVAKIYHVF